MGRIRLDSMPGTEANVIIRRPENMGTKIGHSSGGRAFAGEILDRPARQNFNQRNFFSNDNNDTEIIRTRNYLYRRANYNLPGDGGGDHSWTADGPAKDMPTTRFNRNVRPIVGGSHASMWGQHTDIQTLGINALEGKPRMRPGKKNRLTVQRYRGQSYSQSTKIVGQ